MLMSIDKTVCLQDQFRRRLLFEGRRRKKRRRMDKNDDSMTVMIYRSAIEGGKRDVCEVQRLLVDQIPHRFDYQGKIDLKLKLEE